MRAFCSICMVVTLLCVLVAGVQAITVDVSVYKHDFASNETIPYNVTGMVDGVSFSQKITFHQYMNPGKPSSLGLNMIMWPFAHKDDVFNMTNINTTTNAVYIGHWWPPERGGGFESAWWNGTSANIVGTDGTVVYGTWNETFHYEYDQLGNYTSRWLATPMSGATIVTSMFWINGTKLSGPVNFTGNTSVWSVNPIMAEIDYYESNVHAAHDWFTIDMAGVVTPTYASGDGSGSDSGSGSGSGTYSGSGSGSSSGSSSGSGSGSGSTVAVTTTVAAVASATPAATTTTTTEATGTAVPTTTSGSSFAFAALGALGCAALLLAGRVRR